MQPKSQKLPWRIQAPLVRGGGLETACDVVIATRTPRGGLETACDVAIATRNPE
jgi:hypothetical protein